MSVCGMIEDYKENSFKSCATERKGKEQVFHMDQ